MAAAQGKVPGASATASYISPDSAIKPQHLSSNANHAGRLIVNADDWGRDQVTTDRTLDCFVCGALSSVSAMVFMEDSERAAAVALERGIDAGLHLNLSTRFTAGGVDRNSRSITSGFRDTLWVHAWRRCCFIPASRGPLSMS